VKNNETSELHALRRVQLAVAMERDSFQMESLVLLEYLLYYCDLECMPAINSTITCTGNME
jgi:hypothetical protein